MTFTRAGLRSDVAQDRHGNGLAVTEVTVYDAGTLDLATLWTDSTKTTEADNPVTTDARGNYSYFADPGDYDELCNGVTVRCRVDIDPTEASQDTDVTVHAALVTGVHGLDLSGAAESDLLVVESGLVVPKSIYDTIDTLLNSAAVGFGSRAAIGSDTLVIRNDNLPLTPTVLYTVPAGKVAIPGLAIQGANPTGGSITVDVWWVPPGGNVVAPVIANRVARPTAATLAQVSQVGNLTLAAGSAIVAQASAAGWVMQFLVIELDADEAEDFHTTGRAVATSGADTLVCTCPPGGVRNVIHSAAHNQSATTSVLGKKIKRGGVGTARLVRSMPLGNVVTSQITAFTIEPGDEVYVTVLSGPGPINVNLTFGTT